MPPWRRWPHREPVNCVTVTKAGPGLNWGNWPIESIQASLHVHNTKPAACGIFFVCCKLCTWTSCLQIAYKQQKTKKPAIF